MNHPAIHIIYLSGFGGQYDNFRLWALRRWRFRDVSVELVSMKWESETFLQKIARVDQAIDRARGKRIVLIGESAGGSMAVHIYARRPDELYKVMTICGKNSHPETVGQEYYDRSAAFRDSMVSLDKSINELTNNQRKQFVSIYPFYDETVPVRETLLPDCRRVRLWSIGHLPTIALAITLFSPILVRMARRKK